MRVCAGSLTRIIKIVVGRGRHLVLWLYNIDLQLQAIGQAPRLFSYQIICGLCAPRRESYKQWSSSLHLVADERTGYERSTVCQVYGVLIASSSVELPEVTQSM